MILLKFKSGGNTTGRNNLLVHFVQSHVSNIGINFPSLNTAGDGTHLSTGYLLTHDGSHCEACLSGYQSSGVNQDLPCIPSNCTNSYTIMYNGLAFRTFVPVGMAAATGFLCVTNGLSICASCNKGFFWIIKICVIKCMQM